METLKPIGALALGVALALVAPADARGDENPNPYTRADGTWISISGTVRSVTPNTFALDYGDGIVTVEMDDGDRDADAYKLIEGDKVTVYGKIDDDFYETTTIEASSVYVEKLGTYFYASPRDEEDVFFYSTVTPIVISSTSVQGTVSKVENGSFTIDTGLRSLEVEVDEMPYDPLDDEGYLKVRKGDYVRVTGDMDVRLFEGRVLEAASIVKLSG